MQKIKCPNGCEMSLFAAGLAVSAAQFSLLFRASVSLCLCGHPWSRTFFQPRIAQIYTDQESLRMGINLMFGCLICASESSVVNRSIRFGLVCVTTRSQIYFASRLFRLSYWSFSNRNAGLAVRKAFGGQPKAVCRNFFDFVLK